MSLRVERILGNIKTDEQLQMIHGKLIESGGTVERVLLSRSEAAKNRLRVRSDLGQDIIIDVPRGTKIKHGDVLSLDEKHMLLAEWIPEETVIITILSPKDNEWTEEHLELAAKLGHISGIKHYPMLVQGGEIMIPVGEGSSKDEMARSFSGLQGIKIRFEKRILGQGPEMMEVGEHGSHVH